MAEPNESIDAAMTDEDRQLCESLDRYVDALHDEDIDSRSQLLLRHPELKGLLSCLDSLDSLSPVRPRDFDPFSSARTKGDSPPTSTTAKEVEFGRYRLIEELGRGGMGVVYKAHQTDLDRTVALKMILSSRFASDDEIRRFYTEARAAAGLRHPNIVAIHEVGEIHGQHYFAMNYIDGESLAERLQQGSFDPETAAKYLTIVARAVDYLHANNIVHRDLKPSNILLDQQEQPFVTDFGLAKLFAGSDEQTQSGTIVGTPSYMAPEQAAGQTSKVSPRSDVYSLGAILYVLLTGRPPFKHDNPLDTLVDVIERDPPSLSKLNSQIPYELELICMQCLEKDPVDRYATAADLADDLDRFLMGESVQAREAGMIQELRRWSRREPALVSRLGGLLVAAGIVQAKYMYNGYDLPFHLNVMSVFGIWAVLSFIFQRMLNHESGLGSTRFLWSATDAVLVTFLIYLGAVPYEPSGPLLVGYPLLIAASGMFFRVRLVWFMTIVCVLSYATLIALRPEEAQPPHYAMIYGASLAVLGLIVGYQVHRVRVLSRYYEHRPQP